jgi:hypothetical protein
MVIQCCPNIVRFSWLTVHIIRHPRTLWAKPVNSITRDDIGAYVLSETKRGLTKASIARRINSIYAAINHARDTKVDALASYRAPKRPLGKDANNGRMRILTPDEIQSLTVTLAADERLRDVHDFFLVALGAGAGLMRSPRPSFVKER